MPDFVPPSLATLQTAAPTGKNWVHEIKFDGYRIQARLEDGVVRLLTRKGLDWTEKFPNIAEEVGNLPAQSALIDGEIVVEDERGISNFSLLQAALKAGERKRFIYYVFDLLHLDGRDLTKLPLIERKAALQQLIAQSFASIRYSEHVDRDGSLVLDEACRMKLEGIVSKRTDAPYRSGRSEIFIKTKCSNAQEFVVGGYSPSTAMPQAIGALVAGYYDQGLLVYAGRIGTGYTHATAKDLWKRLHHLEVAKPPFHRLPAGLRRRRDIRWTEPKIVIEAHLRGWTADGLVRQAAFKGVREDKPPTEVVRELPVDAAPSAQSHAKGTRKLAAHATKVAAKKSKAPPKAARQNTRAPARSRIRHSALSSWQDGDVRFTHPDRVYWVDVGVTKQDLADYYRLVWDWMAPHVIGRPLAFVRCPDGTKGQCFFQKHASAGLTEQNLRISIDPKGRQVIAIEGPEGLLSLVQAGVLEIHVRGSRMKHLELCDRIVFDLDPGPDVEWSEIVRAAREVRQRLASIELESFVKLSGGKGLHVVLPIEGAEWDETKIFVQAFAQAMTADDPQRYVAKMTKSLRAGKIFIDYMRNSLEQTSIAAYSTRAREGAPVSVPLTWQELGRTTAANQYTVLNLGKRLAGLKQDPWKDIERVRQKLPKIETLRTSRAS